MRQFVVIGHEAPTEPNFSLDDLPGAGRLDLLARCVTGATLLSHGIRSDVRVHLILGDEFTLSFESDELRGLHPDERSTAARIRSVLDEREEAIGHQPVETAPGISLTRRGFEATLEAIAEDGPVYQLGTDGTPGEELARPADPVFVLSDHREFPPEEATVLESMRDAVLSLGPKELHADHAITVAHNWLDRTGGDAQI
jgi:tRNA (pseudouridine54-N1)-methyltransferase